jgi:uridine kinase
VAVGPGAVPQETVAAVLDHALGSTTRLGSGRLVCIDGPAGSGKSTLARAVGEAALARPATVHVIHTDDLLAGWRGLPGLGRTLHDDVVAPLAEGRPAQYRRFDWVAGEPAEEHVIAPMDLLVLDGVGTGHVSLAPWRATLVWVSADADLRLARGVARDGEEMRAAWEQWAIDEAEDFARNDTQARADLHVDEVGRLTRKS